MALQPTLRPFVIAGKYDSPHTLDVFLDYVCPFSAKISVTIDNVLKSLVDPGGKYYGKVKVILRLQVQPWHATSTYTHEAALAVNRVFPAHLWLYSKLLFTNQKDFFDEPASSLTANQIRDKLADLAANILPPEKVKEFKELIKVKGPGNSGTAVTDDLKYSIKFSRQNGIHVSPTVLWDGLVANQISSSWGEKEWTEFLAEKVIV